MNKFRNMEPFTLIEIMDLKLLLLLNMRTTINDGFSNQKPYLKPM